MVFFLIPMEKEIEKVLFIGPELIYKLRVTIRSLYETYP